MVSVWNNLIFICLVLNIDVEEIFIEEAIKVLIGNADISIEEKE